MKAMIWNNQWWIKETDKIVLFDFFDDLLKNSGFTIMGFQVVPFDPIGCTIIWVLAESHFALHTFPEENKTYIELSSCNEMMQNKFIELFKLSEYGNDN